MGRGVLSFFEKGFLVNGAGNGLGLGLGLADLPPILPPPPLTSVGLGLGLGLGFGLGFGLGLDFTSLIPPLPSELNDEIGVGESDELTMGVRVGWGVLSALIQHK